MSSGLVEPPAAAPLTREALLALPLPERREALAAELRRWAAEALEVPTARVDPARPLTALGLDSLGAVELRNAAESALGAAPSLARLLDGASLQEIAAEIAAALEGDLWVAGAAGPGEGAFPASIAEADEPEGLAGLREPAGDLALSPAASGDAVLLSHGQRSLWFLSRLAPESPAYLIAGAARILGEVDAPALRRALAALVARHDALQTTFAVDSSGEPVGRLDPAAGAGWLEQDASGWTAEELEARTAEEAFRPFDLERGPLLRAALLRGGPGEDRLVLAVHHIAADLWSLEVLLGELGALYRTFSAGGVRPDPPPVPLRHAEVARQELSAGDVRADLPPVQLRHADLARRQAERLAGPRGEALWQFWRRALLGDGGALPRLELPADRPRPRAQTFRGAAAPVPLPAGLAAGLRALGRRRGATLFATILAGFQVLLARWSGQEELLVGTPTSGRGDGGSRLAGLVGYLVNPVVLRADLAGDPGFEQHLERVRAASLAAFAHADYPFPLLAERLQPERDPGRSPVFQAMFALERARGPWRDLPAFALQRPGTRLDLGGLALESLGLPQTTSQLDVTLVAAELAGEAGQGELAAALHYSTDLFDAATAARMAGHLARLLAAAVADPAAPVWELPLLSAAEYHELAAWNATERPVPARTLWSLFAERASERPGAGAVVDADGVRTTYGELHAGALRLARQLRRLGVGPEVPVGILLDPGAERVRAILGVLAAGGGYLSLDPTHPPERLARMLADARCTVLLTRGEPAPEVAAAVPAVLRLDGMDWSALETDRPAVLHLGEMDADALEKDDSALVRPGGMDIHAVGADGSAAGAADPARLIPAPAGPDNLAYVIYTSGSTGEPKGIAVPHAALANLLACHLRLYPAGPGDRTTWIAGPAFDASVWELWYTLAAGAELHVPPRGLVADPERLAAWIESRGLTQAFLPTPVAELHLALSPDEYGSPASLAGETAAALAAGHGAAGERREPSPAELPAAGQQRESSSGGRPGRLRRLFVGGARLRRRPPVGTPCEVVDCYGPAEAAVISAWSTVPPGPPEAGPAPVGRPVDNLRAHVLDRRLQPVPRGALGELYLAGAGLARGYLNRPDLTAERFRPDPFAAAPGDRLYATGDLARHLPDGNLDVLGRADDQVKVRGVRVEPGEVESALARHPAVRQAVVLPREDEPGEVYLAAYVVPAGDPPAAEELRAALRESLPEALVPARFVFLPELPLTPNGKPDRAALPAPSRDESAFVPPGTEVEELLAAIWCEVLHLEKVGIYDNFFDLGGHSLKVHQVLARVRETFGAAVPLPAFFEAPTVLGLAHAIARELMAQADESTLDEILSEMS